VISSIEEDQRVWLEQTCTQQTPGYWNLPRISEATNAGSTIYRYSRTGSGVNSYIIDTGILTTHAEFSGGRATWGYPTSGGSDCNGHGTHVAGTVGGRLYGVAKDVSLIAVKVLDCQGSGTMAGIIAGVDWVTSHYNRGTRAANANMSLGGSSMPTLCTAIGASWNAGVVYVVAAGNSNANACNFCPANCASVITVGATQVGDNRSSFSNFGTCLNVFAPGTNIYSAYIGPQYSSLSGTSMASPHVAGWVSQLQQASPSKTPTAIRAEIDGALGVKGVVKNPGTGSVNNFIHTSC